MPYGFSDKALESAGKVCRRINPTLSGDELEAAAERLLALWQIQVKIAKRLQDEGRLEGVIAEFRAQKLRCEQTPLIGHLLVLLLGRVQMIADHVVEPRNR